LAEASIGCALTSLVVIAADVLENILHSIFICSRRAAHAAVAHAMGIASEFVEHTGWGSSTRSSRHAIGCKEGKRAKLQICSM
jgi:hypothetical protein